MSVATKRSTAVIVAATAAVAATTTAVAAAAYHAYKVATAPEAGLTVPGPPTSPYDGNRELLSKYIGKNHLLRPLLRAEYGNIYRLVMVNRIVMVVVCDAEAAKRILSSDKFARRGHAQKLVDDMFESVLFIMHTGDAWRKHRKFLQPGFGPTHLRHSLVATNKVLDGLCEIWDQHLTARAPGSGAPGSGEQYVTDLFHVASSITIDVIGDVAFSYRYNCVLNHEDPKSATAMKAYQTTFDVLTKRFVTPRNLWSTEGIAADQVRAQIDIMKSAVRDAITSKRSRRARQASDGSNASTAKEEEVEDDTHPSVKKWTDLDVLDRMLESDDWDDDEITDEVIALFLAGGETSANTIVNCALLLDRHPECLDRLCAELDEVLGDSDELTWEKLGALKYTESVVKESLRLMPVVIASGPRMSDEDQEVLGHVIPAGVGLSVDIQGIHHDERYWRHPMSFMPSRWMEPGFMPVPGSYLPFADGVHMCIGWKMAMIELKGVLARIFKKYRLKVVPGQTFEQVTSVTTGFKNGLKVVVERR
ncbi:hypothetical protein HK101_010360 [Irineochytrium annulatum]|nr:hypothetical protein HK101_010360 [Irineochytrium annulatum]